MPRHSRAERRRDAVERRRKRDKAEQREKLVRRVMFPVVKVLMVPSFTFATLTAVPGVHHLFPMMSAGSPGNMALTASSEQDQPSQK